MVLTINLLASQFGEKTLVDGGRIREYRHYLKFIFGKLINEIGNTEKTSVCNMS